MVPLPAWRAVGAAAVVASYGLGSHWLMVHAASQAWAVAALCGPLLVLVTAVAIRRRHLPSLLACAAALWLLTLAVENGGVGDVNRLYVLQHAGIHLSLGWTFGITLRPGSTALISRLAERVHGSITPGERAYTRRLTAIWTGYFVAMAAVSALLYRLVPWPWWSMFGNVLSPLAAAALFAGEYGLRHHLHPEFERASMAQALRAYRQPWASDEWPR